MLYEAKPLRIYDPEANKTYTRATSSDVTTPPIKNGVPQDLPKEFYPVNSKQTAASTAFDSSPSAASDKNDKKQKLLKALLVDDWEFVTKEHQYKVVPLPREVTVADILEAYAKVAGASRPVGTAEYEIFTEVISGIKHYFDRALGNILLYRFERQQYLNIRKKFPGVPMSEIYGPEHLLRLFVSLPALIAQTNMDQQSVAALREHLEECLRFMLKYRSKFFLKEYENTSPHYEAMSRGT
ncbi:hypothetical protein DV495_000556 [Geotrichum candidum]|nr:hypothetical protein DV452_002488 [Geotrichum candidum]KAF5135646.1 hypothetical protein DV495_000556 [Geotrichum candidum]KAF7499294.1 hypothetical protein DV113_002712 [Geotrichum candidum]KAI8135526.1 hypothetical protein DUD61_000741 [Geotrichum candidum]KAI9212534.1 hypothetical protein DS838_002577 [Geotrichum bryndzae]